MGHWMLQIRKLWKPLGLRRIGQNFLANSYELAKSELGLNFITEIPTSMIAASAVRGGRSSIFGFISRAFTETWGEIPRLSSSVTMVSILGRSSESAVQHLVRRFQILSSIAGGRDGSSK